MLHPAFCRLLLIVVLGVAPALGGVSAAVGQVPDLPLGRQEAPVDTAVAIPTAVSDSLLEARLHQIFGQIEVFQDVTASVESGVVRLRGTVPQPQNVTGAEALVSRLRGVLYVINDVEAETDVETRIAPAVEQARELLDQFVANLPLFGIALLVVLLFGLMSRSLGAWETPARWLGVNPLVWQLIQRVVQAAVVLVGLVLAFNLLGITSLVGAALGTAGLVGLAISFAFQDVIENYLAGALLSIQQPFHVNDLVEVEGRTGRVVRLTARELVLLTLDGNHVRLPNATVFKSVTVNYTRNPRRRFCVEVGVSPHENLTEATRIGIDTLRAMNGVVDEPPPFARIEAIGDFAVVVCFYGWVNQRSADFLKVESAARRLVKAALDAAGIDLPEPTYRVLTRSMEEAARETPKTPVQPVAEEAAGADVTPDAEIEAQVNEDLARSDEPNLLDRRDES